MKDGEILIPEFTAEAGVEYTIITEWNWNGNEAANDFSVTVYGFESEVSLTHNKNLTSDRMLGTPNTPLLPEDSYNESKGSFSFSVSTYVLSYIVVHHVQAITHHQLI